VYIFSTTIINSYYWDNIDVEYFHARCESNSELVVIQGSSEPYEMGGSIYKNRFSSEIAKDWVKQEEEMARFYCAYYDEIQPHIERHQQAVTLEQERDANIAWNEFRSQYESPYLRNYDLELVRTENDWMGIFPMIGSALLSAFLYYLGLQIVRIIYQYIVIGRLVWHPYKKREDE
jgi:hypothetical protein